MMRYLSQIFIGTGLIGLLSIPAMTQARMAEAGFQSNVTAFEPSHDSTTLNQPPALDPVPVLVDLAQAIQPNQADAQETQLIEQRNKEIVQRYFDGWRNGTGNFFDLLAPEATWTITGTGETAGTYRKQALIDQPVYRPPSCQLYAASGQMATWSLPCGMEQRPPGTADLIGTPTPGISECRMAKQSKRSPFWICKSSTICGQEFHRENSVGCHLSELERLPKLQ